MVYYLDMFIYIPLHVSGIWIPHYVDNPLETGSIGAGLNLALYAKAITKPGPCEIVVNGENTLRDQALRICRETGIEAKTTVSVPFPLGRGFGISACALIAHSIGSGFHSGFTTLRALQLAHVVEVEYRTGLGDVISEYLGGFVIRTRPGAPGVGLAHRVIPRTRVDLVVVDMGVELPTHIMLSRMNSDILESGKRLFKVFEEREDIDVFFDIANKFTRLLFNYISIRELVYGLRGVIDYYLKKSALVLWIEREFVNDILGFFDKRGLRARYTVISNTGVNVVYSPKSPEEK